MFNPRKIFNRYLLPIILSLIGGLILICILPLLEKIGGFIVIIFINLGKTTSNYYFHLLSQNDPNLGINLILSLSLGFFLGVCYSLLTYPHLVKKLTAPQEKHEELSKTLHARYKKYSFLLIITMVAFFIIISVTLTINQTTLKFRNKLIILKAYISDIEIKKLEASWIQMETKHDFDQINTQIKEYFNKFNIRQM